VIGKFFGNERVYGILDYVSAVISELTTFIGVKKKGKKSSVCLIPAECGPSKKMSAPSWTGLYQEMTLMLVLVRRGKNEFSSNYCGSYLYGDVCIDCY